MNSDQRRGDRDLMNKPAANDRAHNELTLIIDQRPDDSATKRRDSRVSEIITIVCVVVNNT